jgi:hypothetical protein
MRLSHEASIELAKGKSAPRCRHVGRIAWIYNGIRDAKNLGSGELFCHGRVVARQLLRTLRRRVRRDRFGCRREGGKHLEQVTASSVMGFRGNRGKK